MYNAAIILFFFRSPSLLFERQQIIRDKLVNVNRCHSIILIHLICSLKCVDSKTPAGAAEQQSINCRAEAPNPRGARVPGPSGNLTYPRLDPCKQLNLLRFFLKMFWERATRWCSG